MKTSIVPAQITTVEDKIAGNLTLSQMVLLLAPILVFGFLFVALPPFEQISTLKLIISMLLSTVFIASAIRVDGKILLSWAVVLIRYNVRPKYYVFNKNDAVSRGSNLFLRVREIMPEPIVDEVQQTFLTDPLSLKEKVLMELLMADPGSSVTFTPGKKGGIHVRIAEIKG